MTIALSIRKAAACSSLLLCGHSRPITRDAAVKLRQMNAWNRLLAAATLVALVGACGTRSEQPSASSQAADTADDPPFLTGGTYFADGKTDCMQVVEVLIGPAIRLHTIGHCDDWSFDGEDVYDCVPVEGRYSCDGVVNGYGRGTGIRGHLEFSSATEYTFRLAFGTMTMRTAKDPGYCDAKPVPPVFHPTPPGDVWDGCDSTCRSEEARFEAQAAEAFKEFWQNLDPLVLNFNARTHARVHFLGGVPSGFPFDFFNDDLKTQVLDWVAPGVSLLTLPDCRNNVTNGSQLFGSQTPDGHTTAAANGFTELSKYDDNLDGIIDRSDAVYAKLALWNDADSNGVSTPDEMTPLSSAGGGSIVIHLNHRGIAIDALPSGTGSFVGFDGTFDYADGASTVHGEIADVYLRPRPMPERAERDCSYSNFGPVNCGYHSCCHEGSCHSICETGKAMTNLCDPCVAPVCEAHPDCCTTAWTQDCVDAATLCWSECAP